MNSCNRSINLPPSRNAARLHCASAQLLHTETAGLLQSATVKIQLTDKEKSKFWSKVLKTNCCWIWNGWIKKNGYGGINFSGKNFYAHRISFIIANGEIPDSQPVICHRCDNPRCVNPSHLFAGTTLDNVRDMISKGRRCPKETMRRLIKKAAQRGKNHYTHRNPDLIRRGEQHPNSKLKSWQIKRIKIIYASGVVTQKQVGILFGIHRSHVSLIVNSKTWV